MKVLAFQFLFLLGAILLANPATAQALPDSTIKKIDSIFSQWDHTNTPGCVVGVVRNDSLVFSKGYGMANLEYGIPNTPETIWYMASISKQFTAYSILLLKRQGKLTLDDDIHKYLPWFPDLHETITVRQLLNHTNGIRDISQFGPIAGISQQDIMTQAEVVKIFKRQRGLNFKPGTQFMYGNSDYVLLAEIVQACSGQTFRQFTDSAIFKPLGMTRTHFNDDYTEIIPDRADSYELKNGHFVKSILNFSYYGSTGLLTNARDMAKWVMNFYNPVVGDKDDIDMLGVKAKLNNGTEVNYGLGVEVDSWRNWTQFAHGGSNAGYLNYIRVIPEAKLGVFVFANRPDISTGTPNDKVTELFLPAKPGQAATVKTSVAIDSSKAILKDSGAVKKFLGSYFSEVGDYASLTTRNRMLFFQIYVGNQAIGIFGWDPSLLVGAKKDTFEVTGNPSTKFVFRITPEKDTTITMFSPYEVITVKKPGKSPIGDAGLQKYVGDYYSAEADTRYSIRLEDHQLIMSHGKYPDSKLALSGNDKLFTEYWWMKHLLVSFDSTHQVTGFEVNYGWIRHVKFIKLN